MFIEVDGQRYNLAYRREMRRRFDFVEGDNSGESISRTPIFDTKGTSYSYELVVDPDPRYPEDYDLFFALITIPRRKHLIKLPHGAQGSITFYGYFDGGEDSLYGDDPGAFSTTTSGTINRWHGLRVSIHPIMPQREPEDEISVSITPNAIQVRRGDTITFTAAACGGSGTYLYKPEIYQNGILVYYDDYRSNNKAFLTATSRTYQSGGESHTTPYYGEYVCYMYVKDSENHTVETHSVIVECLPLSASIEASAESVSRGETYTFNVSIRGAKNLVVINYDLYFNGEMLGSQTQTVENAEIDQVINKTLSKIESNAGTRTVICTVKSNVMENDGVLVCEDEITLPPVSVTVT